MASPNLSEMATVAIDSRTKMLADNVTDNNMLLSRLRERGKQEVVDGGLTILEEIEYAENETVKRFSGYEPIDISPSDVFTSAQFDGREIAAAVTMSQREKNQVSGKAGMIALLKNRVKNAEKSMVNTLAADVYSDGTASGGKQVDGLQLAVPTANTAGTYGGINRATWEFWRPQKTTGVTGKDNIYEKMLSLWLSLCRGTDKPDLIVFDNNFYGHYDSHLQAQQRFTSSARTGKKAVGGYEVLKFQTADVIFDGGIGGNIPANTGYFLNCDYIKWRPYRDAYMIPLEMRHSTNQTASISIIYAMMNLTCRGEMFQGLLTA